MRFFLRDATAEQHEALEARVGAIDTLDAYRRYLTSIHAFRAPIEAELETVSWPQAFGDWRPLSLVPLLRRDGTALGLDLHPPSATRPAGPETRYDMAGLAGIAYVLEGSTLGSQLIVRSMRPLGLDAGHGASHLAHQSSSVANWQGFVRLLDTEGAFDRDATALAANATFAAAAQAFQQVDDAAYAPG